MNISSSIKFNKIIFIGVLIVALIAASGCTSKSTPVEDREGVTPAESAGINTNSTEVTESAGVTITDGFGRDVTVPENVESVICSGAGSLRYLVYLQAQDRVVGVDSLEKKGEEIEGRPYALANPQLKDYPLIGELRGKDDPEKIIVLNPQVILKTSPTGQPSATIALEADTLQDKTNIPVISFPYGSLNNEEQKAEMYSSLRIMGEVVGKQERAEEVIAYIEATMKDLESRTADIPESERKTVYVGGISSSLVDWDPEYIFIDIGTLQAGNEGAIGELKNDPSLKGLSAVKNGNVYGVIPYNFYSTNYESVLANAYFVGKVLYPDRFEDIDPEAKADEIYTFFLGKPVFSDLNGQYNDTGFKQILQ